MSRDKLVNFRFPSPYTSSGEPLLASDSHPAENQRSVARLHGWADTEDDNRPYPYDHGRKQMNPATWEE